MAPNYIGYLKFGWLFCLIWLVIFLFGYLRDRTKLRNGIWFSIFFYSFWIDLGLTIIATNNDKLIYPIGLLFIFFLFCIGIAFALQAFLLLWNAAIVWRRESHSPANMLTLYLGIIILLMPFAERLIVHHLPLFWSNLLITFPVLCIAYAAFWFYNYLTVLVLYQFYWPRYNKDFIIVLGAGLMNDDQVTPLLSQRIDRGIKFYQKQLKKKNKRAKMILSGGQGGDETVPEGEAMRKYAVAHGANPNDAIAEAESKTTLQNMQYSKRIIDSLKIDKPKTIFVTNNYHTFRAAMFAKTVGLKASGLGSRTARFFLPNAVMREYIAVVNRQRKVHLVMIIGLFLLALLFSLLEAEPGSVGHMLQVFQQFIDHL
ncbi:YdcF family protein [Secundilactobacillus collinoides]|uniref:YdcF family protein n=1 Tax=Secundilactobacillus collinoides TaxID=33960 RepID=UPI0007EED46C|nr:YdcF family protein [Secundilactobacillus collinoides]